MTGYKAKCMCGGDAKWVRLRMKPNVPYYYCNACYSAKYPAGQSGIYVQYPRNSD